MEEGIDKIGQEIKNAARELRGLVNELRPPSMLRFGLARAMQAYLEDIENQHPGIEFVQEIMEDEKKLSDQTSLALFRICQECLHNTIKHAGATRIWVRLTIEPAAFVLELRDNGKGFILIEGYLRAGQPGTLRPDGDERARGNDRRRVKAYIRAWVRAQPSRSKGHLRAKLEVIRKPGRRSCTRPAARRRDRPPPGLPRR